MAQIYDLQAIREQTRRVLRDPQHLRWITPPSLKPTLDWYRAYGERHEKPLGVGCEQPLANHSPAPRVDESPRPFPEPAA